MGFGGHRTTAAGALLLALLLASPAQAAGSPVSPNVPDSAGLVEEPKKYDGETVTFTGEAVGEAMVRGENAWIHINDDAYYERNIEEGQPLGGYNTGMAVWLPADLTRRITCFGDYKHEGDVVTVRGTFNAACAEHGGDMDIHATSLEVDVRGHHVTDVVKPYKLWWAAGLSGLAALLWWLDRTWKREAGIPRGRRGLLGRRA